MKGKFSYRPFDDPDRFRIPMAMILKVEVTIIAGSAHHKFNGLTPKRYGIAVYHDENDNDESDQGFLASPLEGYAFSNNAPVFLGPPSLPTRHLRCRIPAGYLPPTNSQFSEALISSKNPISSFELSRPKAAPHPRSSFDNPIHVSHLRTISR